MQSLWMDTPRRTPVFSALDGRIEVDTVIVGGGITGLTTALRLLDAGRRVAVLEGRRFGALNTGGATGNLYATVSRGLHRVRRKWGDEVMCDVVRWRGEAVDGIEALVQQHGIKCDFARRPLLRVVAADESTPLQALEEEFDAAATAGMQPGWVDTVPGLPFGMRRAFRVDDQAQFNPYRFALGLVRVLSERGALLFEDSHAISIDAGNGIARTAGGEAHGREIVLATHSPSGFNLVQSEMEPYREHGISAALKKDMSAPVGIHWIEDEGMSIRSHEQNGRRYLVVVGAKHLVGDDDGGTDFNERLRQYARERFGVSRFEHAWGAEQLQSADSLPYIGRSAHDNVLIATGFAGDGLTWGAFSASIVDDLVHGRDSAAIERLTPRRFTPLKSARIWASENFHVMKHLVRDWFSGAEFDRLDALAPGDGAIVDLDGEKRAVSRSADGDGFSVLSSVCTHMGCQVQWNGTERSWDCPCHGSRFDTAGAVLDGPAMTPLECFSTAAGRSRAAAAHRQQPRT